MTILDEPQVSEPADASPPSGSGDGSSWFYGAMVTVIGIAIALTMVGMIAVAAIAIFRDDSGGGAEGAAGVTTTQLDIELTEFAITGELTAPAGNVSLNIVNNGAIEHNLAVRELDVVSRNLMSRGEDSLVLENLAPGTYELYCNIPGHEASGMVNELEIVAGDIYEPAELSTDPHAGITNEELDEIMIESMLAFPAATETQGNQILEPVEILADGTKRFELVAEVIPWEVAPGEFVEGWAYNGMIPGPWIKLDLGDKVEIELTNLTPMSTDIHWHGIHVPNDQDGVSPFTQDPIRPGDTYTYEFTADEPAIGMYHSHLHSQVSLVNGMFAAIQVGETPLPLGETISGVTIPEDIEIVYEEPMVLNDAGTIGLTLNGKSFPATAPIVMNTGEWGIIHYYNEGLTAHPMHLHQFPQLIFAKDGVPLDQPFWADTVNVAPGERYSVLFQASDPGAWVFHCHILTHVESADGMFGMVTAVVVNDPEA